MKTAGRVHLRHKVKHAVLKISIDEAAAQLTRQSDDHRFRKLTEERLNAGTPLFFRRGFKIVDGVSLIVVDRMIDHVARIGIFDIDADTAASQVPRRLADGGVMSDHLPAELIAQ